MIGFIKVVESADYKKIQKAQKCAGKNRMKNPNPALRAEVTLGLLTEGRRVEKAEVIRFLTEEITAAISSGARWVPLLVADAIIAYARDGRGYTEQALTLSSDRNPRYNADLSDDEWRAVIEALAGKLAREFGQQRVYVTYLPAEVVIVTPQSEEGGRA
ncbi:hypothetical protein A3H09_02415 [Candidatus Falkowbacteria bacterium RIFCSPLOWO2_12_FULL_45_13]|uniref:Uncharacterized protein n=1 Tax=Candidatus Falkowbacteria bacterium RIFCSPLOWO2_12_FULL_45_13 TaxID=1797991 RepID=A0A1F5SX12_9BACT|nr:MAG: hypothetical protein A3H09_02415 [Candidatus Falkowbacteria bacterium RIFCSPLOWO2_12_FULL_45_13]